MDSASKRRLRWRKAGTHSETFSNCAKSGILSRLRHHNLMPHVMINDYAKFVESKTPTAANRGMRDIPPLSSHLFGFQKHCVEFLLSAGSGGLFLDTGLGKTLVLTPLAVAKQIEREGLKFGYDARVIRDQSEAREGINICNYDRLHLI